ncbi:MAG: PEP-CTERM sorting domain-containing protein [Planctomycetes bacterium]|nr:PEP-CTERM sorting domain-containing protein [Planctomycetota bacterium]
MTLSGNIETLSLFGQEMYIDSITVIPEPASLSLAALGALLVARRRRRG